MNGNNEISRIRFSQSRAETESIYSGNVIVCKKTNHQHAWIITSWMCPLNDLVKTQALAAPCHRQWLCRVQFCCCVLFSIDMTAHLSSWDAFRKNKQVLTRYIWKSKKNLLHINPFLPRLHLNRIHRFPANNQTRNGISSNCKSDLQPIWTLSIWGVSELELLLHVIYDHFQGLFPYVRPLKRKVHKLRISILTEPFQWWYFIWP